MQFFTILILIIVAFLSEYIAATLGMGYGTTLTPILVVWGYDPVVLVPVVLFSQIFAGLVSASFHQKYHNMDLTDDRRQQQSLGIFVLTGFAGVTVSTFTNIVLPPIFVKTYIALSVLMVGLLTLSNGNRCIDYSVGKIAGMGILAGFNKGISGGGYGPITTSGQMLCDIPPRAALAITALVEGIICVAGFFLYYLFVGVPNMFLIIGITAGALLASPFSALTTSKLEQGVVKKVVGVSIVMVGFFTLIWVLLSGIIL
ncbi:MAG: sulfite exporter TauE/SafE family protein [Candidatus Thorarchaeota archaeon]